VVQGAKVMKELASKFLDGCPIQQSGGDQLDVPCFVLVLLVSLYYGVVHFLLSLPFTAELISVRFFWLSTSLLMKI
jgi:hypothetical protein